MQAVVLAAISRRHSQHDASLPVVAVLLKCFRKGLRRGFRSFAKVIRTIAVCRTADSGLRPDPTSGYLFGARRQGALSHAERSTSRQRV